MAALAPEIHRLSDELAICQVYDTGVKAELFSTALTTSTGLLLIDPVSFEDEALKGLTRGQEVRAVIVTNANHLRASHEVAAKYSVPIYAHAAAGIAGALPPDNHVSVSPDVKVITIAGAPNGEIALHCGRDGGTLVLGDALINFGSHGFTFLPAKYCSNAKLMGRSLRELLNYSFERMLFAHGRPIMVNARARLLALLESET